MYFNIIKNQNLIISIKVLLLFFFLMGVEFSTTSLSPLVQNTFF